MNHSVLRGKLCAALCDDCTEPLAHVQILAFTAEPTTAWDLGDEGRIMEGAELAARSASLLGRATTDGSGGFALELGAAYGGGPLTLELWCSTVPGRPSTQLAELCGVRLAVITPAWRRVPSGLVAPWEACVSSVVWGALREHFDARVLCGQVRGSTSAAPRGGVHVSALWQSDLRCSPIGDAITDASGRFRIDYAGSKQRDRARQIPDGKLVFRLTTAEGEPLAQASPRKPHALDLSRPCSYANLSLRESPRLVRLSALHSFLGAAP